ncbi:MAG: glycosyltransferase family 4 protein, partial [Candidatus Sericytochromatia bacterium]|nr:glycosyltransferase family 4 protein [Candidatus Tanganyikabacteria bacterium]
MNVCLVGPSPVPYVVGGVENLLAGLQHHIARLPDTHCELLKLPSREHDFWSLLASYEQFFRLDVSHFDLVITTKYPAWMVRHPNHVCYVQHRLRGLYDTYSFCGEPTAFSSDLPAVRRVLDVVEDARLRGKDGIERAFAALAGLRAEAASVPADVFRFPGPFIRKILMFLDDRAMNDGGVKRFLAISRTVAQRKEYFPAGASVTVAHHPSFLTPGGGAPAVGGEPYILSVSRLDGPKRVGLLVEAMREVDRDIDLVVAGTGPQEPELRRLAAGDSRIRFLGYTPDLRLADLYAGALAVAFVPYQEDYGLITIEAMRAGKPVLTTSDAGGPNEFVVDGETGYSVAPQPGPLAERIRYFADNPGEAARMGSNARERVAQVTWDATLAALLGRPAGPGPDLPGR